MLLDCEAVRRVGESRLLRPVARAHAQMIRWEQLCDALEHPAVELTVEEFAPVLATFRALERCGCPMDRMLTALIAILERQVFNTHEDSDSDRDMLFRPARSPRAPKRRPPDLDLSPAAVARRMFPSLAARRIGGVS